jgi:hypothetical protein
MISIVDICAGVNLAFGEDNVNKTEVWSIEM